MNELPTFKDLYDFVMVNKTNKSFIGYSEERIIAMLKEGIDDKTLYYALSPEGKMVGMLLAIKDDKQKILFISENLSMSLHTLKLFAEKGRKMFPGYRLEAMKHSKHRKFNIDKLCERIK